MMTQIRLIASFVIGLALVSGASMRLMGVDPGEWVDLTVVPIWVAVLVWFVGLFLMFPTRTGAIYGTVKDKIPSFGK